MIYPNNPHFRVAYKRGEEAFDDKRVAHPVNDFADPGLRNAWENGFADAQAREVADERKTIAEAEHRQGVHDAIRHMGRGRE